MNNNKKKIKDNILQPKKKKMFICDTQDTN